MTISAAAIIFKDPLTAVNISGLGVTIISIAGYNYIKIKKMRQEAAENAHLANHNRQHGTPQTTGYAAVVADDDSDIDSDAPPSSSSGRQPRIAERSNAMFGSNTENELVGMSDVVHHHHEQPAPPEEASSSRQAHYSSTANDDNGKLI